MLKGYFDFCEGGAKGSELLSCSAMFIFYTTLGKFCASGGDSGDRDGSYGNPAREGGGGKPEMSGGGSESEIDGIPIFKGGIGGKSLVDGKLYDEIGGGKFRGGGGGSGREDYKILFFWFSAKSRDGGGGNNYYCS